jgi:hypothetical protein
MGLEWGEFLRDHYQRVTEDPEFALYVEEDVLQPLAK